MGAAGILFKKAKDANKIFAPIGFSLGYDNFYSIENGAGGFVNGGKILTVDNDLGVKGQLVFLNQDGWSGGRSEIKLLYSVPSDAKKLVLERGLVVRPGKEPGILPPGQTTSN